MAITIEGTIRKMRNRRRLANRRRTAQLQHLLQQYESESGKIIKTLMDAHKSALGKKFDQANKTLKKLDGVLEDKILDGLMELNDTMAGVVGLEATAGVRRRRRLAVRFRGEDLNVADLVENLFRDVAFRKDLAALMAQVFDCPNAQEKYYKFLSKYGVERNDLSTNEDDYLYDAIIMRVTNHRTWGD